MPLFCRLLTPHVKHPQLSTPIKEGSALWEALPLPRPPNRSSYSHSMRIPLPSCPSQFCFTQAGSGAAGMPAGAPDKVHRRAQCWDTKRGSVLQGQPPNDTGRVTGKRASEQARAGVGGLSSGPLAGKCRQAAHGMEGGDAKTLDGRCVKG